MATFKVEIKLGNDAMRNAKHVSNALRDLAYSLRDLSERDDEDLKGGDINGAIRDNNGNKVGTYKVTR